MRGRQRSAPSSTWRQKEARREAKHGRERGAGAGHVVAKKTGVDGSKEECEEKEERFPTGTLAYEGEVRCGRLRI